MLASILIYPLLITAIIFLALSYWKRRKRNYIYSLLPGPKSQHWILGDLPLLVGRSNSKELGFHVPSKVLVHKFSVGGQGHDTTATGMSWTLYHLGRHPEIQQKAFEEVQRILGNDKDKEITSQDLKEMKYLECVLKENLRISPSGPSFSRVATEEVNINGYTIPRNTSVVLFVYGLHRDPKVFPKPDVFNPDRFLPENCVGRHPFAYVPFSAGARNCIGQKFAMNEMKIILCNALQNFIFESIDPIDYIKVSDMLILKAENGIRMKITKRE